MKNGKFAKLYETVYNRYKQGSGFLEGDVVELKKNFKNEDSYKDLNDNLKGRLEDAVESGLNLRVGRLHTPAQQYGGFGVDTLPATHADVYQEISPGNFGNLVTVPVNLLNSVDTGINLAPVSKKNKRDPKEAPYQDPTEVKQNANKGPEIDEQNKLNSVQNYVPNGNYKLATKDTKPGQNAKKYDDSKPSKFKPLPKNKTTLREGANNLLDIYASIHSDEKVEVIEEGDSEFKQFNVHDYVADKYSQSIVDAYEDDHGTDGLDKLWSAESKADVDNLLGVYTRKDSNETNTNEGFREGETAIAEEDIETPATKRKKILDDVDTTEFDNYVTSIDLS